MESFEAQMQVRESLEIEEYRTMDLDTMHGMMRAVRLLIISSLFSNTSRKCRQSDYVEIEQQRICCRIL